VSRVSSSGAEWPLKFHKAGSLGLLAIVLHEYFSVADPGIKKKKGGEGSSGIFFKKGGVQPLTRGNWYRKLLLKKRGGGSRPPGPPLPLFFPHNEMKGGG
jgi:hypothetical protein